MPVSVDPSVPVFPIDVDLYHRLLESGALSGLPIELVDGVFVEMMSEGGRHSWAQGAVAQHLIKTLDVGAFIVWQNSGVVTDRLSVPEPDVYVMSRSTAEASRDSGRRPQDALLVVEVSDSSRAWDLGRKRRLYATAEVPDYWVVDLVHGVLVVHRDPRDDDYATVSTFAPGEPVSPLDLPVPPFDVAVALPPADASSPNASASSS
jgi:Uma2 family endonuclease